MKQHITKEQYYKLSPIAREKLWKWMRSKGHSLSISSYPTLAVRPSIGAMIEFLDENKYFNKDHVIGKDGYLKVWAVDWVPEEDGLTSGTADYDELCDALWEAVKEILEKK